MDDLNKRILVNFRIPAGLKLKFETVARRRGKSMTGFVQEVMEFAAFTDPEFWEAITKLTEVHRDIVQRCRLEKRNR